MIKTQSYRTIPAFLKGRMSGQLVIQFTDACNARCPQCGMRVTSRYPRCRLPMDELKRIIDHAAAVGVQAISFTGGEPFLYLDDLVALIHHAGKAGIPMIRTGTNGFLFAGSQRPDFKDRMCRLADRLANTALRNLWISIDSADPAVHETMRGFPGIVKGIEKALPIFHARGLYPSANLGINRNMGGRPLSFRTDGPEAIRSAFSQALRHFFEKVIHMGFSMVNMCYPMSIPEDAADTGLQAVYGATATDDIVRFTGRERRLLFKALLETIPLYRDRIRIFTPLTNLYALAGADDGQKGAYPCRGGVDFFFIDARSGHTFPCGYRGNDDFGKFYDIDWEGLNAPCSCKLCDWECFRDPSELAGPVLELLRSPAAALRKLHRDPVYRRLWIMDLTYYRACGFFDGRKPPAARALARCVKKHHRGDLFRGKAYGS